MASAANNAEIIRDNFGRYAYLRDNGHLEYVKKANKCDDYFQGLQWDPILKRRLESQGKPALTINKTLATLAAVMGEQLNNRADITFKPLKDASQESATVMNKVYLQIANENKMDWIEANVADDGFITGRGFYDVRVEFDENMKGQVNIKSLNPRNVLIDSDAEEYDPDTWKDVIVTRWMTLQDIELNYGKDKAERIRKGGNSLPYDYDSIDRDNQTFGGFIVPPDALNFDDVSTSRKYRIIERQHRKLRHAWHFVDPVSGEVRPIPDNWTTARIKKVAKAAQVEILKKKVEQIRWTVTCHNTVLHDEWSPYKHFTIVPYFPFFRHGATMGIVENLLSSQDLLNKATSQELHIVNTTANSGWKVKSGSLHNMTIEELEERGAETGLVVELDDPANLEKITPNQVPTGLDRVGFKADEFIKQISGVSDSARGFDRADVAAKAIQAKQAAGSINLAKPMDNLARTRHLVAKRVLDLVQTYYHEERVMIITGNRLDAKPETLELNKATPEGAFLNDLTIGDYGIVVTTAPAKNNFQESQFQEAVELRKIGVQIPDSVLIQNSSLANKEEIIAQFEKSPEQQQLEQQQRQIDMQKAQIEMEEMKTKAMLNRANAMLLMKRATEVEANTEKIVAETMTLEQQGGFDAKVPNQQNQQQQLPDPMQLMQMGMKRREMQNREKMDRERMQFDRDMKEREFSRKQQESEAKLQLQREQMMAQQAMQQQAAQQANQQPSTTGGA
jgi:hypothetical protein